MCPPTRSGAREHRHRRQLGHEELSGSRTLLLRPEDRARGQVHVVGQAGRALHRETVKVSVTIATPDAEVMCFGRWMQTDREGNFTFPEQRPYYYTFPVE